MMNPKTLGFQTGKVVLPGLDIVVELNANQYFRNDGIVEDINLHTDKVFREFKINPPYERIPATGRCICINCKKYKTSTISITDISPISNLLHFGHESTHALINLGIEHYLIKALQSYEFALNPFRKYSDEEEIADIGGLLSVYKAGTLNQVNLPRLKPLITDLLESHQ